MTAAAIGTALRAVFGSTGAVVDDLHAMDAAVHAGLPLSRRIGFVAVAGGAGTTTAVTAVAGLLSGRRRGSVLAVDADGGWAGIGRRFDLPTGRRPDEDPWTDHEADPGADHAARRRTARTAADARAGLPRISSGLHLLDLNAADGAGPVAGRIPRPVADWTDQLGPIARFHDLVLTDWGVRPAAEDLDQVALSGHVLVVLSRAGRQAATTAADTVAALRELATPPRLLLVLTDVDRTPTPDRLAAALQRSLGVGVHRLPYDPAVGTGRPAEAGRSGFSYRRAVARLAAAVMTEAVASQAPGRLSAAAPAPLPHRAAAGRVVRPA